jgi:hypothetical protein
VAIDGDDELQIVLADHARLGSCEQAAVREVPGGLPQDRRRPGGRHVEGRRDRRGAVAATERGQIRRQRLTERVDLGRLAHREMTSLRMRRAVQSRADRALGDAERLGDIRIGQVCDREDLGRDILPGSADPRPRVPADPVVVPVEHRAERVRLALRVGDDHAIVDRRGDWLHVAYCQPRRQKFTPCA